MANSKTKTIKIIKQKFEEISFYLNEKTKRIWAATEAKSYGWGGIAIVAKAIGLDHKTIQKGLKELAKPNKLADNRIRQSGGGRKKMTDTQPQLLKDLESLIDPLTRGDPDSPLRWTCKSTYNLADTLREKKYQISQKKVYNLLIELGYSLQSNKKSKEGSKHPDRNAQFEYLNQQVISYQKKNCPSISVDTKKKEKIGNFKNNGQEYNKKGLPEQVRMHDFVDQKLGQIVPYGVYDLMKNNGWVNVGISSDTAEFAVNSIRGWWHEMGKKNYQNTKAILITADCGGSNGYKVRLWKKELQQLANELQKTLQVCHFPPGTSKWNKIEHKMFSYISKNWRGRPLLTRETVVNLISNTKNKMGLQIKSRLDENIYKTGIKVSDEEMNNINIKENKFHGEWNYKIIPQKLIKLI